METKETLGAKFHTYDLQAGAKCNEVKQDWAPQMQRALETIVLIGLLNSSHATVFVPLYVLGASVLDANRPIDGGQEDSLAYPMAKRVLMIVDIAMVMSVAKVLTSKEVGSGSLVAVGAAGGWIGVRVWDQYKHEGELLPQAMIGDLTLANQYISCAKKEEPGAEGEEKAEVKVEKEEDK